MYYIYLWIKTNFTYEIAVRLGPKITATVKGKLSLGARVLQVGGVEKIFKQLFSVREGAKLLKASQCYISTTSGPIAGLLFISTNKAAFCSERSIKISSPKGEFVRAHYKVQSHMNDDRYYISLPMIANILIATYLCRS